MARALERIGGLNTQIVTLEAQIAQSGIELSMLQHIDDDAQRDALVSEGYDDRAAARMTGSDVERMRKQIRNMERTRDRLVGKRDRLITKLAAE
jgi:hypothetical protein